MLMLRSLLFFGVYALLGLRTEAQGDAMQAFHPASIPMAVRTPYMSTWLDFVDGALPLVRHHKQLRLIDSV